MVNKISKNIFIDSLLTSRFSENIDATDFESLLKEYPAFNSAYLLESAWLNQNEASTFKKKIPNTAVNVRDRAVLHDLIYKKNFEKKIAENFEEIKTIDKSVVKINQESKNVEDAISENKLEENKTTAEKIEEKKPVLAAKENLTVSNTEKLKPVLKEKPTPIVEKTVKIIAEENTRKPSSATVLNSKEKIESEVKKLTTKENVIAEEQSTQKSSKEEELLATAKEDKRVNAMQALQDELFGAKTKPKQAQVDPKEKRRIEAMQKLQNELFNTKKIAKKTEEKVETPLSKKTVPPVILSKKETNVAQFIPKLNQETKPKPESKKIEKIEQPIFKANKKIETKTPAVVSKKESIISNFIPKIKHSEESKTDEKKNEKLETPIVQKNQTEEVKKISTPVINTENKEKNERNLSFTFIPETNLKEISIPVVKKTTENKTQASNITTKPKDSKTIDRVVKAETISSKPKTEEKKTDFIFKENIKKEQKTPDVVAKKDAIFSNFIPETKQKEAKKIEKFETPTVQKNQTEGVKNIIETGINTENKEKNERNLSFTFIQETKLKEISIPVVKKTTENKTQASNITTAEPKDNKSINRIVETETISSKPKTEEKKTDFIFKPTPNKPLKPESNDEYISNEKQIADLTKNKEEKIINTKNPEPPTEEALGFMDWLKKKSETEETFTTEKVSETEQKISLESKHAVVGEKEDLIPFERTAALEAEIHQEIQQSADPLESFISSEIIRKKRRRKPTSKPKNATASSEKGVLVSETLAEILTIQQKYTEAIDVYTQLSLKYPQKSIYFANQIEKIKNYL